MPGKKEKLPLSVTHPELAKEADGWDPKLYSAGSGSKLAWRCESGHKWEAVVYSRSSGGRGCPFCSGQRVIPRINDLATLFPEVALEASGWDPSLQSKSSKKKVAWKCIQGHFWEATISNRTYRRQGCPICSNRQLIAGLNDLASTHPEIAKEATGWDPSLYMSGYTFKKEWKCKLGHSWEATIASRTRRNTGCPVCSGKKIEIGFNDLQSKYPDISLEADGWDPKSFTSGSGKKKNWKCSFGHTWSESINNRTRKGYGCPVCSNHKVLAGFNDFGTTHPEIAKEAHGWNPSDYLAGNNHKFDWKCKLGHIWSATLVSRTSKLTGCPICSNQKVLSGFNDLKTKYPLVAAQAHGWNPAEVISGSEVIKEWKCPLGHIWRAQVAERALKGFGCRVCSGRQLLEGFNDLQTKFPEIAQEAFGWDPNKTLAGYGKKKKWKCQYGHIWESEVSVRTSAGTGCPTCGNYGFSSAKSGWIYLIAHPVWQMLQVGITNDIDRRLSEHFRKGWEVLEIRGPIDGLLAQRWETAILRMLKANGADLSNKAIAGKFDGYSEAWSRSTFEVGSIKELMRMTEEFERSQ